MPNHVDSADSVLKFTQEHTIFGGIFESFRRFSCVAGSAFGFSPKLLSPPCNHSFAAMASLDPIDISSSDSDSDLREIDNYRDVSDESPTRDATPSVTSRILPAWASSTHSNLAGDTGISQKDLHSSTPPSKRQIISDDISLRPHKRLNSAGTAGPSTLRASGNVHQRVGSNNYGIYDTNHDSSHQPMKSMIPAAHQSSSSWQKNNLIENVGTSEVHGGHGRSFQRGTWPSTSNGNNSMKENFNRDMGNNSSLFEKKGNRLLPPSLMPGLHASATPFIGLNDPFHHAGLGEEGPAGTDERFVFQAALQDLHQPTMEAALPNGLLSVSLFRHQKIALAWMLSKESSGLCLGGILADDQGLGKTVSIIALIQMQKTLEAKSKSKRSCNTSTEALNLDDDDDANGGHVALDDANKIEESGDFAILTQESNALKGFRSKRPTAGTLVVCPASVIRQWSRELEDKVTPESRLRVLIYHGANRTKNPNILAKYDVVLTTYAIVTNEVPKQPLVEEDDDERKDGERHGLSSAFSMEKKRKKSSGNKKLKGKKEIDMSDFDSNCGTLAKVKWSRVVLDESQTIKNHRTQVARACCSLRAKRRWCLSGTPIQNSVDELFSYFRFLRYDPYDKLKHFGAAIKGRISRDSVIGYKKLQVILRNIMLRRTKGTLLDGKPIITLPPKRIQLSKVEFSLEERNFYSKLEADSQKQFKAYAAAGTVNQNYANILLMLLRLRQACDHPLLVKGFGSADPIGKISCQMAERLPRELLLNLWNQLETSLAICRVCRDPPENAVVTICGHVFCYQCVSDNLTGEDKSCPVPECKEQLGVDIVYSRSTLRRCISDDIDSDTDVSFSVDENCRVLRSDYISSKIKRALEILKLHCISKSHSSELSDAVRYDGGASSSSDLQLISDSRGSEKAIVFSQWTSMLDLVEMSLKNNNISYRRLDGTMSIAARDKAVKDFNSDPEVDVMLMSLKAGNLGLNMVAASRVILLDLWWNPSTEDQAIDRAHRIGQTRPVTVSRITIKDTVEDRILSLQEDKRKMVASAFGEDKSGGHVSRLTAEDLRYLFGGS